MEKRSLTINFELVAYLTARQNILAESFYTHISALTGCGNFTTRNAFKILTR